ncbi:MAG TPA: hypothetical protein VEC16_01215 [Alphaproteobacteria bacterium]|nr:hypothetical protein [Alphaproteobacteria bacterium]
MGWSISDLVNNVKISDKCAKELYNTSKKNNSNLWDDPEYVTYDGKLAFNEDHQEHMDYIRNEKFVRDVLKKNKVKGDICFGSVEGDNKGSFWGYRFDGKGGMQTLGGKLEWYVTKSKD